MATPITITICGDGGCGKSSITLRIVRGQWTHEYDPTIEDSYSVTRTIDGTTYNIGITDTAGQEEYRSMWSAANMHSDAFLLVYDITSTSSLHQLAYFTELIDVECQNRQEAGECWPALMVLGNKCDLQSQRQVPAREALEWAKSRGYGFMETSAREMVNIEETISAVVKRVVEARRMHAQGLRQPLPGAAASVTRTETRNTNPNGDVSGFYGEKEKSGRPEKKKGFLASLKCW
ncbi:hypothetical protein MBLNU457_g2943t1 [Dothideomycetes sp. NU457]